MPAMTNETTALASPAGPSDEVGLRPAALACSGVVSRLAAARRPLAAMLDQALVSGASFTAVVLIGRVSGERQLGLYSLAASLVVLAIRGQESLVLVPYTVFAPRAGDERRRQIATSALTLSGWISLALMAVLAIAVTVMMITGMFSRLAVVLAALFAAAPALLLRDFARRFALTDFRFSQVLKMDGAVTLLQVAALLGLALGGGLSAASGIAVCGGACGLVAVVWLIRSIGWEKRFAYGRGWLLSDWRASWSLGSWLLAGNVIGIVQAYALHWLLAVLLDVEATGAFAAIATLAGMANPLVIGLGNFLMPAIAHAYAAQGAEGIWRLALRATGWLAAALVMICLLAAAVGGQALTLLYGARFGGHSAAFTLLVVGAAAAALDTAAEHALRTLNKTRSVFIANLLALLTTLALAAWLVPRYGVIGAAGSMLAGNVMGSIARWSVFWQVLDSRLPIAGSSASDDFAANLQSGDGGPYE